MSCSHFALSRSLSAEYAIRYGHLNCFETRKRPDGSWMYVERQPSPQFDYAKMYAEGKDFVHHVEQNVDGTAILIVSCTREEITKGDAIPDMFLVEPITPSLFDTKRVPVGVDATPFPSPRPSPAIVPTHRVANTNGEIMKTVFEISGDASRKEIIMTAELLGVPKNVASAAYADWKKSGTSNT